MRFIFRKPISGKKRGRKIGFPTINLPLRKKDKIKRGVYLIKAKVKDKIFFGVANVGKAKTFGEKEERVEIHLFDFKQKKIDFKIKVWFLKYLRKVKKFKNKKELKEAIRKDIKKAKKCLQELSKKSEK